MTEQARNYTVREAAERLRIGSSTLYRLVRHGRVPHSRLGTGRGRIVFTAQDIASILADGRDRGNRT